jgi:hypothetical protein
LLRNCSEELFEVRKWTGQHFSERFYWHDCKSGSKHACLTVVSLCEFVFSLPSSSFKGNYIFLSFLVLFLFRLCATCCYCQRFNLLAYLFSAFLLHPSKGTIFFYPFLSCSCSGCVQLAATASDLAFSYKNVYKLQQSYKCDTCSHIQYSIWLWQGYGVMLDHDKVGVGQS